MSRARFHSSLDVIRRRTTGRNTSQPAVHASASPTPASVGVRYRSRRAGIAMESTPASRSATARNARPTDMCVWSGIHSAVAVPTIIAVTPPNANVANARPTEGRSAGAVNASRDATRYSNAASAAAASSTSSPLTTWSTAERPMMINASAQACRCPRRTPRPSSNSAMPNAATTAEAVVPTLAGTRSCNVSSRPRAGGVMAESRFTSPATPSTPPAMRRVLRRLRSSSTIAGQSAPPG